MTEEERKIAEAIAEAEATAKAEAEAKAAAEAKALEDAKTPEQLEAEKLEADKKVQDAISAAIRQGKIDEARKLIEDSEPKKPEVDLSGYVEKEKFDEALKQLGELKTEYQTSTHAAKVENIIAKFNLSEEDVKIISCEDLKEFEERAELLASRNNTAARARAVQAPIPEDLKNSDLAGRLL